MKIIRVFPRKTNATPEDEDVRVATSPGIFDEADQVRISVAFEWDKEAAEILAYQWEWVAPVTIGGPAYGDPGGDFEPGVYIKKGYVITSRGCPNRCWFCQAWRNEGNVVRELSIKQGWNVLDNNLLACSTGHQERVFKMLLNQSESPRFTGGFEAKRFTERHAEWMVRLKPHELFFAYDTPDDFEPLVSAAAICAKAGLITGKHRVRCYVLCGWRGDTISSANERMDAVAALGIMPMAMLFNLGAGLDGKREWMRFQREWARPAIIGSKMKRGM
jgi:hypothetical protein